MIPLQGERGHVLSVDITRDACRHARSWNSETYGPGQASASIVACSWPGPSTPGSRLSAWRFRDLPDLRGVVVEKDEQRRLLPVRRRNCVLYAETQMEIWDCSTWARRSWQINRLLGSFLKLYMIAKFITGVPKSRGRVNPPRRLVGTLQTLLCRGP